MGTAVAATTSFVGNPAGDQMNPSLHKDGAAHAAATFSPEELMRRRQASRRLAWLLGAAALAFYLAGFLLKR
jgi:hypothetical protein